MGDVPVPPASPVLERGRLEEGRGVNVLKPQSPASLFGCCLPELKCCPLPLPVPCQCLSPATAFPLPALLASQEGLGQLIPDVPSNLGFWDKSAQGATRRFVALWHKTVTFPCLNPHGSVRRAGQEIPVSCSSQVGETVPWDRGIT